MIGTGIECGDCFLRGRRIAERHSDVAQPAHVADAPYRAADEPLFEFWLAPREQADEFRCVEFVAWGEVGIADLRKAIPRAAKLTIVASVDAISDGRA